ncbi:MAG: IPT/TIG domain-containing protein, partial [Acidobacteriia bacterium]|nr:IPT/TIG domain-containing protein [Terriglobia bacterium]
MFGHLSPYRLPRAALCGLAILLLFAANALAQPTISFISPDATTAGSNAFTMTIHGSGLVKGATVWFGVRNLPAVLLNATTLQVQLGAELLRMEGSVEVRVDSP